MTFVWLQNLSGRLQSRHSLGDVYDGICQVDLRSSSSEPHAVKPTAYIKISALIKTFFIVVCSSKTFGFPPLDEINLNEVDCENQY